MKYGFTAALFSVSAMAFASAGCAQTDGLEMPESAANAYAGVYAGSYVCSAGDNGLTVSLDSFADLEGADEAGLTTVEGRLWFYDLASNAAHPEGAFTLSGTIDGDGDIELSPGDWISEIPANWGAAGISGSIAEDGGEAAWVGIPTGPGTEACETFVLKRLKGL